MPARCNAQIRPDVVQRLNPTPYKVIIPKLIARLSSISFCPMSHFGECTQIHAVFDSQVSVSEELYEFLHDLWEKEAPIRELS